MTIIKNIKGRLCFENTIPMNNVFTPNIVAKVSIFKKKKKIQSIRVKSFKKLFSMKEQFERSNGTQAVKTSVILNVEKQCVFEI